jgi:hypothetical protein
VDPNSSITSLAAMFAADTDLTAWRTAYHDGKAFTVLRGNRTLVTVQPSQIPALIMDLDPMQVSQRLANQASDVVGGISGSIVWQESNPDDAFTQRVGLPQMIINAVMSDPRLGGSARNAHVIEVMPLDGDASKPNTRLVYFKIAVGWEVQKT